MSDREVINDVLVHLFNEISKVEEIAIRSGPFGELSNNDMHIIAAIGLKGDNMSAIARKLNITVGSLTTAMNSLVKKRYVERVRSEKDRRIVNIHLTANGIEAYHYHEEFHEQMTDAVLKRLGKEQTAVLATALEDLSTFFRDYGKK